jgi:hypothetical protein
MSGALGKVQAEESELGLPFSNAATGIQTHEMILEANYNIHVYRGVDCRPEFQYIIRPHHCLVSGLPPSGQRQARSAAPVRGRASQRPHPPRWDGLQ